MKWLHWVIGVIGTVGPTLSVLHVIPGPVGAIAGGIATVAAIVNHVLDTNPPPVAGK